MILFDGSHSRYQHRGTHGVPALGMIEGARYRGQGAGVQMLLKTADWCMDNNVPMCIDHEAIGHLDPVSEPDAQVELAADEMGYALDLVWKYTNGSLNVGLWNRPNFQRHKNDTADFNRMLGRSKYGRNERGRCDGSAGVFDKSTVLYPSFYLDGRSIEDWKAHANVIADACRDLNKRWIAYVWVRRQDGKRTVIDPDTWRQMIEHLVTLNPDGIAVWCEPDEDKDLFARRMAEASRIVEGVNA